MIYLSKSRRIAQTQFYYIPNSFSSSQLEYLETYFKTLDYNIQNGKPNEDNKLEHQIKGYINRRSYNINYLVQELKPFINKLEGYIDQVNKNYNFDLEGITDISYLETYKSKNPLDWHNDIGEGDIHYYNRRKLSFSLIINDPQEYKGGILEINTGNGHGSLTPPNEKGTLIFFPSFMLHRVTAVTKGVRKSLVGFIGGEPYK